MLAVICVATVLSWTFPLASHAQRIVNGLNTHGYPTAGALLYSGGGAINSDNAGSWCSGTLIGCETFLTAAHCVVDDPTAANYWVYLQHSGISVVSSIEIHSTYTQQGRRVRDPPGPRSLRARELHTPSRSPDRKLCRQCYKTSCQ